MMRPSRIFVLLSLFSLATRRVACDGVTSEYYEMPSSSPMPDDDILAQLDSYGKLLPSSEAEVQEATAYDVTLPGNDNMPDELPDELEIAAGGSDKGPYASGEPVPLYDVDDDDMEDGIADLESDTETAEATVEIETATKRKIKVDSDSEKKLRVVEQITVQARPISNSSPLEVEFPTAVRIPTTVQMRNANSDTNSNTETVSVKVKLAVKRLGRLYHNGVRIGTLRVESYAHSHSFRFHHARVGEHHDSALSSSLPEKTFTFSAHPGDVLGIVGIGYPHTYGIQLSISTTFASGVKVESSLADIRALRAEELPPLSFYDKQLWKTRSFSHGACEWPRAMLVRNGFMWAGDEYRGRKVLFRFVVPGKYDRGTECASPSPSMIVNSEICACREVDPNDDDDDDEDEDEDDDDDGRKKEKKKCYEFVEKHTRHAGPCKPVRCEAVYECLGKADLMPSDDDNNDGDDGEADDEERRKKKNGQGLRLCTKTTVMGYAEPVGKEFHGFCRRVLHERQQARYVPYQW